MNRGEMSYARVRDVLYSALRYAGEGQAVSEDLSRQLAAAVLAVFEEAQKPSNVRNGEHSEGDHEAGYEEGFHHGRSTPVPQGEPSDAQVKKMQDELEYRVRTAAALTKFGHEIDEEITKGRTRIAGLAASLRAAGVTAEEPEWEYGIIAAAFGGEPEPHSTREAAKHVIDRPDLYRKWTHGSAVTMFRRRKAGPWEEVPDE